jgi:WXG100 family type VII secretion target
MPAQRIRYDSERMMAVAREVQAMNSEYSAAASQFNNQFESATSEWQGASKDKMLAFVEGPVAQYLTQTVPQLLEALGKLLEENAKQMQEADEEIARNIPDSLG